MLSPVHRAQLRKVVNGGENERAKQQSKTAAQPEFLGTLRDWFSKNSLASVEKQIAAIKERNGHEIHQAEIDRERGVS
jgi:hypothetical protein